MGHEDFAMRHEVRRRHHRTTTKGKPDVCDQRSTIEMSPGGATKLRVETRLTKKPGAETVEYDRVYTRINEPAVVESRA